MSTKKLNNTRGATKCRTASAVQPFSILNGHRELPLRQIRVVVDQPGFRTQGFHIVTTLLDPVKIAYNCVRRLMYEAAEKAELHVRRVCFKGNLQEIRSWSPQFDGDKLSKAERNKLLNDLYGALTGFPLPERPGRSEPRCKKSAKKGARPT